MWITNPLQGSKTIWSDQMPFSQSCFLHSLNFTFSKVAECLRTYIFF